MSKKHALKILRQQKIMTIKLNLQEHKKEYIFIGLGILMLLIPFVLEKSLVWANIAAGVTFIGIGIWQLIPKKKRESITEK